MELPKRLHARIKSLSEEADALAEGERLVEAEAKYREAMALLPKPAAQWEAATWLFTALGDLYFERQDFETACNLFASAVLSAGGLGNPYVHLRLGQCRLELGEEAAAQDELARALMGGGEGLFEGDDPKYLEYIQKHVLPEERH